MCLRVVAATILASVCLPAADPSTLGLVIRRTAPVSSSVRQYFESETAQAIHQSLQAGNLNVVWREEGASSAYESFDRLIVVSFQGDCSTMMPRFLPSSGPLGWTSTAGGRVLPFIGIDCTRVKSVLAEPGGWQHSVIPAGMLARALSRVAMHEIYHVLSDRTHHDDEGLFKAEYSSGDLLAPPLRPKHGHTQIAGVSDLR